MRPQFEKACDIMSATASRMLKWAFTERAPYNPGLQHDTTLPSMLSALTNKSDEMCGLAKFIAGARNCKSREDEEKLINKELAKIRNRFKKRTVDGYTKRKYVCKLLFIFLMGRNIDFGHLEALSLLSSNVYYEKQMGYLFLSILFDTSSETIHLLIRCIKSDFESHDWASIDLAIKCIANIGNKDMALEFTPKLLEIIESKYCPDSVIQSALLCYLKLYIAAVGDIKSPDICKILSLLSHRDLGVVFCATTLIDALVKGSHGHNENEIVRIVVTELWRILSHSRIGLKDDYAPNRTMPAPWLLVNLLRVLQNFTIPKEPAVMKMLNNVLDVILIRTQEPHVATKEVKGRYSIRQSSASAIYLKYAVFFEAVNVITQNTDDSELWSRACPMLDKILATNIPNLRYMAFESMGRLATSEPCRASMKDYQPKALYFLRNDVDVSIQHRAVNFLYSICDKSNVDYIVGELLDFLHIADYSIREAIALQVAIIADHWLPNYSWYVDVLLKLISIAGDFIDEQVYSKVIQTVTTKAEIQKHATYSAFHYLKESTHSETLVRLAGFILGEFGHLISDIECSSITVQWKLLHSKFTYSCSYTKATLLTTFMKIANKFPETRSSAVRIFTETAHSTDVEVQNRSVEYLKLLEANFGQSLLSEVFRELPPFEDEVLRIVSQRIDSHSLLSIGNDEFGLESGDAPTTKNEVKLRIHNDASHHPLRNYFVVSNDDRLKVSMKSEYLGHSGKIVITYVNKKQTALSITVQLSEHDSDSKLGLSLSLLPKELEPGMEVEQMISVVCFGVFDEEPTLNVSLFEIMEGKYPIQQSFEQLSIKIPIFVNNFFKPAKMSKEDFFEKWETLDTINFACRQETFEPQSAILVFDIHRTIWKLRRFNIRVLNSVRQSSNNIVGAAFFVSASSNTGCLFMLEPDVLKVQFRLTIKSPDPSLTTQVMKTLKNIL